MPKLHGVSKRFGTATVLNNVTAEFGESTINFIMGPNGVGKSTLVRCVLDLHPHEGTVTWKGNRLSAGDRLVSIVFEDAPFYPRLTGLQNLKVLSPESLGGQFTYLPDDVLHKPVRKYSHGQRMRLALTMAFNSGAEVIILDEPTNGLDRGAMAALKQDIRSLAARTTFLITGHHLEFYDDMVDNVFFLKKGELTLVEPSGRSSSRTSLAQAYDEHFPSIP